MRLALLLVLFGALLPTAHAAEKYTVLLNERPALTTTENKSPSHIKSTLKKQTYKAIGELNASLDKNTSFHTLGTYPFLGLKIDSVLWGINGFIAELSSDQVKSLRKSPLVKAVRPNKRIQLDPLDESPAPPAPDPYTYGLQLSNVVALRAEHPEFTGKGVVVGVIDSGVDATHPDIAGKVAKWKDFTPAAKPDPYDDNSHGTHVTGTILGGNASGTAIGVAPEATVISAKIFDKDGYAYEEGILQAMQWMLDPDDDPSTNDSPAVVSNSWGGTQDSMILKDDPYVKMIDSWIAAGIFPSFAAGNSGSQPYTVGVPGGIPAAFAVGAVDSTGLIAYFSSRGPIRWQYDAQSPIIDYRKPEVAAPGVKVYSSVPGGAYASYSGTSMATPHVSGIVALIKQANPALTPNEIRAIIMMTAVPKGSPNAYGSGLIDAKAAVLKALEH